MADGPRSDIYSRAYLERGEPTSDSRKARIRLGSYIDGLERNYSFRQYLKREGGIVLGYPQSFESYFEKCSIVDVLDSISLIFTAVANEDTVRRYGSRAPYDFIAFVGRVFDEENLKYKVDSKGFVHPIVDREFADTGNALLRGLKNEPAILKEVDHCYSELAKVHPRRKIAVRAMFEALEILVKRMVPGATKLDSALAKGELSKLVIEKLGTDPTSKIVLQKNMIAFGSWIDSVHFYRHGQSDEDPIDVPEAVAISLVSAGAAYLRMLLDTNADQV